MLYVQNRELVVPGQLIAEGGYNVREGAFREGKQVYASVVGLAELRGQDIRIIPLQGRYIPKPGDVVIGVVVDSYYSGWILDINSPYTGNLFVSDLLRRKVDLVREDISPPRGERADNDLGKEPPHDQRRCRGPAHDRARGAYLRLDR